MSKKDSTKIIALKDYLDDIDSIFPVPVSFQGEKAKVEVRIRKPMAKESQKLMEMVAATFGDKVDSLSKEKEFKDMSDEEKDAFLYFQYLHALTLVSSCCFWPDLTEQGKPIESPKRIWNTPEEVGEGCPDDMFGWLKNYLQGTGSIMTEVEAKN